MNKCCTKINCRMVSYLCWFSFLLVLPVPEKEKSLNFEKNQGLILSCFLKGGATRNRTFCFGLFQFLEWLHILALSFMKAIELALRQIHCFSLSIQHPLSLWRCKDSEKVQFLQINAPFLLFYIPQLFRSKMLWIFNVRER